MTDHGDAVGVRLGPLKSLGSTAGSYSPWSVLPRHFCVPAVIHRHPTDTGMEDDLGALGGERKAFVARWMAGAAAKLPPEMRIVPSDHLAVSDETAHNGRQSA